MSFWYSRVQLTEPVRLGSQAARGQQRVGGHRGGMATPVELTSLGISGVLTAVEGLGKPQRRAEV